MRLHVKNIFMSFNGSSTVKDDLGREVFFVKGNFISFSRKKKVLSGNGNLLYSVRNRLINMINHSAYIDDGNGTRVAKVTRKGFRFDNKYVVEGYDDEIEVTGNFFGWSLEITRNGRKIGTINRELDWTDSFVLETDDEESAAFMVALVIAIDNILDNRNKS